MKLQVKMLKITKLQIKKPMILSALTIAIGFVGCKEDDAVPSIDNSSNIPEITQINNIIESLNDDEKKAPDTSSNLAPVIVFSKNETSVFSESYDPEGEELIHYWAVDEKVISDEPSFLIASQTLTGTKEVWLYVYDGHSISYDSKKIQFSESESSSESEDSSDDNSGEDSGYEY